MEGTNDFRGTRVVVFGETSKRNCRDQELVFGKTNKLRLSILWSAERLVKEITEVKSMFGERLTNAWCVPKLMCGYGWYVVVMEGRKGRALVARALIRGGCWGTHVVTLNM